MYAGKNMFALNEVDIKDEPPFDPQEYDQVCSWLFNPFMPTVPTFAV